MLILYAQKKGGVGKTTLAVHHAVALHDAGHRVALLDADEQRQAAEWSTEAAPTLTVATASGADDAYRLAQQLAATHDIVIADGPATLGSATRALLTLADLAVIPLSPSILDLRAADKLRDVVAQAKTVSDGRPNRTVLVLNKVKRQTRIAREMRVAVAELGFELLEIGIRELQAFPDSVQQGTVVTRMAPKEQSVRRAQADLQQYWQQLLPITQTGVTP